MVPDSSENKKQEPSKEEADLAKALEAATTIEEATKVGPTTLDTLPALPAGEQSPAEIKAIPEPIKVIKVDSISERPAEPAPFDVSEKHVEEIIDELQNKGEVKTEKIKRPEEPPKEVEEDKTKIYALKAELVGSLTEMTSKWVEVKNADGKVSPEERMDVDSSYSKVQKVFFKLTGESLDRRARVEARAEAEKEGKKIVSRKEFFGEKNIADREKKEQMRRWGEGIRISWAGLSNKEKNSFNVRKEGNEPTGIRVYARYLEAKRKEVEVKAKNACMPKDAYYNLLAGGFRPQDAVVKGIFRKKISMYCPVSLDGDTAKGPGFQQWKLDYFKDKMDDKDNMTKDLIKQDALQRLEDVYNQGRQKWMDRKIRKVENITESIFKTEINPEPIDSRDNKSFEKTIEATKTDNEMDLLDEDQLGIKEREAKKKFEERTGVLEKLVDDKACISILSMLRLTKQEIVTFKEFVKKGTGSRPGKIPANLLGSFIDKRKEIKLEYDDQIKLISTKKEKIRQQKLERAFSEIREKLAAA